MRIDTISNGPLASAAAAAHDAEGAGYDGVLFPEIAHDPFLPVALAAQATERVELFTGIAVAFARNPMSVAVTANDLHRLSGGRFVLGLGSQIKPHITKRFSMPWSHPAARMREYVAALRAIWASWEDSTPLDFRGDFYTHTLMTPMFDQGPSEHGPPKVFVAAVGPAMTRVAGEVADGLMAHGFTTPAYFRDVTMAHLAEGLAVRRTRADADVEVDRSTDDGDRRPRPGEEPPGDPHAARLLRVDAGVPAGARAPRLGRPRRRAQPPLEGRRLGEDGRGDRRRGRRDLRHRGRPRTIAAEVQRRFGAMVDRIQTGLEPALFRQG